MRRKLPKYLLAALLFSCIAFPAMQVLVLNPFEHEADFELSDFYERTRMRRTQQVFSEDIVLVAVDRLDRDGIVRAVRMVSEAGAAVTVLDIFMDREEEDDGRRAAVLADCRNLVLPVSLEEDHGSRLSGMVPSSLRGYAELSTPQSAGAVIRRYRAVTGGETSLAATAVRTYAGDIELDEKERLINYSAVYFDKFDFDEFEEDTACVAGRIAIVCNVNDFGDVHETPVGMIPGAYIQACIMDTILHRRSPAQCPPWIPAVLGFVLCTLLFWVYLRINLEHRDGDLAAFFMRLAQGAVLVLVYVLGAVLFVKADYYIDSAICMLLIAAEAVMVDCALGIRSIYLHYKNKKN